MKCLKKSLAPSLSAILVLGMALAACSKVEKVELSGGNAEGFGGGDGLTGLVKTSEAHVMSALTLIQKGTDTATLCQLPSAYPNLDKRIQRILSSLTPGQVTYCKNFITANASNLLAIMQKSPPVGTVISLDPVQVIFPNGQLQPVDAKTLFGPSGDITFSAQALNLLTGPELDVVVAHEFLHKIFVNSISGYVTDNDPIGPFTVGRDLLDNVGAGIALYYSVSQQASSGSLGGIGSLPLPPSGSGGVNTMLPPVPASH